MASGKPSKPLTQLSRTTWAMMAMVRTRVRETVASPITIQTTVLPRLTVASLKTWSSQLYWNIKKGQNDLWSDDLCTEAVRDPMSASPLTWMDRWMEIGGGIQVKRRGCCLHTSTWKTEDERLQPSTHLLSASDCFLGGTEGRGLRAEKGMGRSWRWKPRNCKVGS